MLVSFLSLVVVHSISTQVLMWWYLYLSKAGVHILCCKLITTLVGNEGSFGVFMIVAGKDGVPGPVRGPE